ncbi:hypothetical protein [Vagococcus sp. CY52-2]|uniref:hypothetical protein n=1 Tax=Vagococcus sp. CY52-2 TaxID=2925838 RepID=UPI001F5920C9|nr:hypothetical protein [Vagococcus sp. CY52-2]UNM90580.1 hypothetical protein MN187_10435 [Vagococcus sp. CY52-2]UNM90632.1 hypothetical protein MN187_10130 [Vagococcus sp. CY52-2]
MILLTKKKRNELANELALNITNYEKTIQEFKGQVDILTRERDAAKLSARDTTRKYERATEDLDRFKSELRASESEVVRVRNRYEEYKSKVSCKTINHDLKNYKERVVSLQNELEAIKELADKNKDYREAYEFISELDNRNDVIDNFSHNLNQFMLKTKTDNSKLSRELKTERSTVRELRNGKRIITVKTIQYFDELLCDFYGCSVKSLVMNKLEV